MKSSFFWGNTQERWETKKITTKSTGKTHNYK